MSGREEIQQTSTFPADTDPMDNVPNNSAIANKPSHHFKSGSSASNSDIDATAQLCLQTEARHNNMYLTKASDRVPGQHLRGDVQHRASSQISSPAAVFSFIKYFQPYRFLDMPPEIRLQVYELIVGGSQRVHITSDLMNFMAYTIIPCSDHSSAGCLRKSSPNPTSTWVPMHCQGTASFSRLLCARYEASHANRQSTTVSYNMQTGKKQVATNVTSNPESALSLDGATCAGREQDLRLLRTCRQIYDEARLVLYHSNTFVFLSFATFAAYFGLIAPTQVYPPRATKPNRMRAIQAMTKIEIHGQVVESQMLNFLSASRLIRTGLGYLTSLTSLELNLEVSDCAETEGLYWRIDDCMFSKPSSLRKLVVDVRSFYIKEEKLGIAEELMLRMLKQEGFYDQDRLFLGVNESVDPIGRVNIYLGLGIMYSPIATRAVITLHNKADYMRERKQEEEAAAWLDDNNKTMADSLGDNEGASGPYSDTDNLDPKEIPSIISASNSFTTTRISPLNAPAELSSSAKTSTPFRLFDLPLEIRLMIYDHAMGNHHLHIYSNGTMVPNRMVRCNDEDPHTCLESVLNTGPSAFPNLSVYHERHFKKVVHCQGSVLFHNRICSSPDIDVGDRNGYWSLSVSQEVRTGVEAVEYGTRDEPEPADAKVLDYCPCIQRPKASLSLNLLRTSKKIHEEAARIPYESNTFIFQAIETFAAFFGLVYPKESDSNDDPAFAADRSNAIYSMRHVRLHTRAMTEQHLLFVTRLLRASLSLLADLHTFELTLGLRKFRRPAWVIDDSLFGVSRSMKKVTVNIRDYMWMACEYKSSVRATPYYLETDRATTKEKRIFAKKLIRWILKKDGFTNERVRFLGPVKIAQRRGH
ncbi:MAG: hypothetical protein ASARMPREDX12_009577 [Alectoria sarmentosa]|nr:MAG: hypothetical protein ASARMPREDX12_009577 [Alectoria sarmentosa]